MKFKSLPVFALLMLSGCSLMPDYQQPAAPVQAQWPTGEAYGGQGDQRSIAAALPEAKISSKIQRWSASSMRRWRTIEIFESLPKMLNLTERFTVSNERSGFHT